MTEEFENTTTVDSHYFSPREISIGEDEIVVVSCGRNEAQRLPYFLEYYRGLGATRFLIVDNNSTDETAELLRAQPDVEYFHTTASYRGSSAGRLWMQELADTYAVDRWVVTADADELLVFPGSEVLDLRDLIAYLEAQGQQGLFTLMLDMFSDRAMSQTVYSPGTDFLETCRFFEADTYEISSGENPPFLSIVGGPRGRLFGGDTDKGPMMKKVPLVKWHQGFSYVYSTHSHRFVQLSDVTGALLHFKFFNTFAELAVKDAVRGDRRQQAHYTAYSDNMGDDLCFYGEQSVRYESPGTLLRLGMMRSTPLFERFQLERSTRPDSSHPEIAEQLPALLVDPDPVQTSPMSLRNLHQIWPLVNNPNIARHFGRSEPRGRHYRLAFLVEMRRHVRVIDVTSDSLVLMLMEPALHRWQQSNVGVAVYLGHQLVRRAMVDGSDTLLHVDTESLEPSIARLDVDLASAAARLEPGEESRVTIYLFDGLDDDQEGFDPDTAAGTLDLPPDERLLYSGPWYRDGAVADGSTGYNGALEALENGELRGWVYDLASDRFNIPLVLYINGRVARALTPWRWQPSLAPVRGYGSSLGGRRFMEKLPLGFFEDSGEETIRVEAYVGGTNIALRNSPMVIPSGARTMGLVDGTGPWAVTTAPVVLPPVERLPPERPLWQRRARGLARRVLRR